MLANVDKVPLTQSSEVSTLEKGHKASHFLNIMNILDDHLTEALYSNLPPAATSTVISVLCFNWLTCNFLFLFFILQRRADRQR